MQPICYIDFESKASYMAASQHLRKSATNESEKNDHCKFMCKYLRLRCEDCQSSCNKPATVRCQRFLRFIPQLFYILSSFLPLPTHTILIPGKKKENIYFSMACIWSSVGPTESVKTCTLISVHPLDWEKEHSGLEPCQMWGVCPSATE